MSDKLDRLVATRVMGWTVRESDPDDNDYERYTNGWAVSRWNPSTSIAAAWEVVEHLRKQRRDCGWRKYLVSIIDHMTDMEVTVQTMGGNDIAVSRHESAPIAICLAALRAVGVPEPTIQEACK